MCPHDSGADSLAGLTPHQPWGTTAVSTPTSCSRLNIGGKTCTLISTISSLLALLVPKSKYPNALLVGKLMLLSTAQHPWSHLAIDFITDLPKSQSHITIMVIIDQFSKSLGLILLPGLPSAFETAEIIFLQVFQYFGITSDKGPQFTSKLWSKFMDKLGVSVSLTSNHQTQSNGQREQANQKVRCFLRTFRKENQRD